MMEQKNFFKGYSNEALANRAIEELRYRKAQELTERPRFNQKNNRGRISDYSAFFQDLQEEIVNRFISQYKTNDKTTIG